MGLQAKRAAMMNKMTRSEKIVTGLAVAVLVAGFATGVFARPINMSAHSPGSSAHALSIETHREK